MITIYSTFVFSDFVVQYLLDGTTGQIGLRLLPEASAGAPVKDHPIDSLVHVFVRGGSRPGGFANGQTMRESSSSLRFDSQQVLNSPGCTTVKTRLVDEIGYMCEHHLSWTQGDEAVEVQTVFENTSESILTLEMITSFSMDGITPYDSGDAPARLVAHRFRSGWSAEGRHEHSPIELLHLERSHSGAAAFSQRFGQVGSMPVRSFFPFVAIEDSVEKVFWGAQLAWAGSWQMEIYRKYDDLTISGGLADREFGHWFKHIQPRERFETPRAVLSTVRGTIDHLCARLTAVQQRAADLHPESEKDLPVLFNEWCTTWGNPSHDNVLASADLLKNSKVRLFIIDAGWWCRGNGSSAHGDWEPCKRSFPQGLEATAQAIRDRGMVPGLWFEVETCGSGSSAFALTDHLLKLDGSPLTVAGRRFWDMCDPWVVDHLSDRVIGLIKKCGFGYLKIDYNEAIGIGCDGAESPGEGLRRQIEGVYAFFRKIRESLPDVIIENCASGGHRLEPSMMALTSVASFSDAHENVEIPVIAANLHRLILPRQSQIWAVMRRADSERRMAYSLAATFLGRMCLSGDLTELTKEQWNLVNEAVNYYENAVPIIRKGFSRRFGPELLSFRHPQGWQALLRTSGTRAMVVIHSFAQQLPEKIEIDLPPEAAWNIEKVFPANSAQIRIEGSRLICPVDGEFFAASALLRAS